MTSDEGYGGIDVPSNKKNDEDTRPSSLHALELQEGGDSDEYETDTDEEDEEYELTSGRRANRFSTAWRPKELMRCCVFLVVVVGLILVTTRQGSGKPMFGSSHPPPGAVGVGHSSYDTVQSTRLEEYAARLTLYRHRVTGAEFLAFIPDAVTSGPSTNGNTGRGEEYDPKPDKVFGVAFRTKPESSTGVPHILEREFLVSV